MEEQNSSDKSFINKNILDFMIDGIRSEFFGQVSQTYATRMLVFLCMIVMSIIIARTLGPEGRGVLAVASSITAIGVQFGSLGFHTSNTFFVAKDKTLLPNLIGNSVLVIIGSSVVIAGVYFYLVRYPHMTPIHGILLQLAFLGIIIGITAIHAKNLFIGLLQIKPFNIIELSSTIAHVVLVGIAVFIGRYSVIVFYALTVLTNITALIWTCFLLWKHIKTKIRPSAILLWQSVIYGIKAYFSCLFAFLIRRVDLLMINYFLGFKASGIYAIAIGLINILNILPEIIGMIAFPRLCRIKDWHKRTVFTHKIVLMVLSFSIPAITVLIFFAKKVIILLYGLPYADASDPLFWFLPGFFILSIEMMYRRLLVSKRYPWTSVAGWGLAFVANVALNIALIPRFGISGAAMASSISYGITAMITIYIYWNRQKGRFN